VTNKERKRERERKGRECANKKIYHLSIRKADTSSGGYRTKSNPILLFHTAFLSSMDTRKSSAATIEPTRLNIPPFAELD
jgi:hypothetical protein